MIDWLWLIALAYFNAMQKNKQRMNEEATDDDYDDRTDQTDRQTNKQKEKHNRNTMNTHDDTQWHRNKQPQDDMNLIWYDMIEM